MLSPLPKKRMFFTFLLPQESHLTFRYEFICCKFSNLFSTKGVKAVATTTAKLLDVETSKHPLARGPESIGFLNPPLKIYKTKRKSVTERSLAREDEDFVPVQWRYIPRQEEMEVDQVKRERDDRGVVVRAGDIAEEFQIRYLDSSERVGKQNPGIYLLLLQK